MTIQDAIRALLLRIGEDSTREGLINTPDRVARMYGEIFNGYAMNPKEVLSTMFTQERHREMVVVRDIEYYSMCEHHMLPFFGKVHIGYIPNGSVVGISKLARLVECYSRRLQIQERMTTQIADEIMEHLKPYGCAVIATGDHLCMRMRGVESPCANTVTSAVRGIFDDASQVKQEFLTLIGRI